MNKLIHLRGDAVLALKNNEIDFLMHCCNTKGVMGSGIALQIKNSVPDTYERYNAYCRGIGPVNSLGSAIIDSGVINLIAQLDIGRDKRQCHYGALAKGIRSVIQLLIPNYEKPLRIGVPYKMACDRAGGDWAVVEELLESFPSGYQIVCYKLQGKIHD
jgi:hypothetical protein